ncbi:MAG: hypothetical protein ABIP17_15015 [Ilumatobacteraceae bacterium]
MNVVLVAGAAATWAMVGLIWMVQVVHYPLLGQLSALSPGSAATDHQRRISWVVGPLMATEGITALALLVSRPATIGAATAWVAAVLLGVALLSTVAIQVPQHARLSVGHDDATVEALITRNWIRTVAWTARGVVLAIAIATPA